jgi:hypothetical protein
MMKARFCHLLFILTAGSFACSSADVSSKMSFYHGQTVPRQFFKVVRYSPQEVEFEIRVDFQQVHMYHIVLDENGKPLSEGWHLTTKLGPTYKVVMKAKKGAVFQEDKKYRLCIGNESPEKVFVTSNNYQCLADYEFVLSKK